MLGTAPVDKYCFDASEIQKPEIPHCNEQEVRHRAWVAIEVLEKSLQLLVICTAAQT